MTTRIVVVPGPGLDAAQCVRWGTELGLEVDIRAGDPVTVLGALASRHAMSPGASPSEADGPGPAGVVIAPGSAGFDASGLAAAISRSALRVVAVDPSNLRKAGIAPEATRLAASGARVIYGRAEQTARHALLYLANRHGQRPDTLAYGREPSQEGDLWIPAGSGPHPVTVLFHGGFWYHAWERDLMDGLAKDLARRGIAAWNAEYRRVGAGGGWPITGEDAARAVDHLVALAPVYGIDLDRVAVLGHSSGGHLALWVAARGRRGAVHPCLVVGLATVADLEEARHSRVGGGSVDRLLNAGPDADDSGDFKRVLSEASPLARLPIGVPQLLAHAGDDEIVPPSQTTAYAAAARAAGDDVAVIEIDGGGHFATIDPASPAWATVAGAMQVRL